MSRIGKKTITLPKGVAVDVTDGEVAVKGPKGELKIPLRPEVCVELEGQTVRVKNLRGEGDREARAYHGLTRALISNMVTGVSDGFERKLEISGVGYGAKLDGDRVTLNLGFANELGLKVPAGVTVEVPSPTSIVVRGCDKQSVGQFAAQIRKLRPPEPYKGKGIKYDFEIVRRKAGKAFGSA